MRYMWSIIWGVIAWIIVTIAGINLMADQLWGMNLGMIAGILVGVVYFYYKEYRQQERVDGLIEENK